MLQQFLMLGVHHLHTQAVMFFGPKGDDIPTRFGCCGKGFCALLSTTKDEAQNIQWLTCQGFYAVQLSVLNELMMIMMSKPL